MIGFNRNAWSDSAETGGRIQPKRVIAFTRNPQHAAHTRQGYASAAVAALTSVAFTLPGIEVVEIHLDRANLASEGVPRKLGFTLVAEHPRPSRLPPSPAESGIFRAWRMTRDRWRPPVTPLPPPSP